MAESDVKEARDSARALGTNLLNLGASNQSEIEAAFEILIREQAGALLTNSESLFMVHSAQLAALTARHRVPALYAYRENALAGGLMSYGANFLNAARELGVYVGRVLKGDKPAELPVQQATKIELVINMNAAKALGLTIPTSLLVAADEVIERGAEVRLPRKTGGSTQTGQLVAAHLIAEHKIADAAIAVALHRSISGAHGRSNARFNVNPKRLRLARRQTLECLQAFGNNMEGLFVDGIDRHLRRAKQTRIIKCADF